MTTIAPSPPVRPCIATAAIATCLGMDVPELAVVAELDEAARGRLPEHATLGYAVDGATGEVFPPGAALPRDRTLFASIRIPLPTPPAPQDAVLDVLAGLAANGWRIELQPPLEPSLSRSVSLIRGRPADLAAATPGLDGSGVLLGVVDFGCDFAHPAFTDAAGASRLEFLWDQNTERVLGRADIDAALAQPDPYAALDYRPDDFAYSPGAAELVHGTHVLSVAAGRGTEECPAGVAPGARLAFVHLRPGALVSSGDPADVFDGVCAVFDRGARMGLSAVVNLSLGANAGSHDGNTAFDRGLDALLEMPGRAICVSAGNERQGRLNMDAKIAPGSPLVLDWAFAEGDATQNTLRVLCDAPDGLPHVACTVRVAGETIGTPLAAGANAQLLRRGGQLVGVLYSGIAESSHAGPMQQVELRLIPSGHAETWQIELSSSQDETVEIDAWIDRDDRDHLSQSSFAMQQPRTHSTLTSTACGRRTICVGAFDQTSPSHSAAAFSAEGTTRDGRQKPDVAAPGMQVLAAAAYGGRVRPGSPWRHAPTVRMSGTSVAAPHVAGVLALMLQQEPGLAAEEAAVRLRRSARPDITDAWHAQLGFGRVDAAAALALGARRQVAA